MASDQGFRWRLNNLSVLKGGDVAPSTHLGNPPRRSSANSTMISIGRKAKYATTLPKFDPSIRHFRLDSRPGR